MNDKYIFLNSPEFQSIPQYCQGVYYIYCIEEGVTVPINRVLKTDYSGVLYIGVAHKRSLFERICDFKKCVLPNYKGSGHTAGRRYNKMPRFMERFPYYKLAIKYEITDTPVILEKRLLEDYMNEFGEVPPLNSY